MQKENTSAEQIFKNMTIIWGGLFSSQVMFLVIIYFLKPELYQFDLRKPVLGGNAPVILLFAALAVSIFIISVFLSKRFINEAIDKQRPALVQNAMVIGCALCEAITILGFMLAFVFDYQYFFIWIAFGILGIIFHFPRRDNLHLATFAGTPSTRRQ